MNTEVVKKEAVKSEKAVSKKGERKPQKRKPAKAAKQKRETISSTARELILAGKTNEQVMEALAKVHGVDREKKKHYAGWYRAQLVRDGLMSKVQAAKTRH